MERGSDKHSPMVDEALKHDTESRGGEIPGAGLSPDDLNGRAELARYFEHRTFPARPDELAAHARQRHAPDGIVALLERAPDQVYETVSEVWAAVGGRVENPRDRD